MDYGASTKIFFVITIITFLACTIVCLVVFINNKRKKAKSIKDFIIKDVKEVLDNTSQIKSFKKISIFIVIAIFVAAVIPFYYLMHTYGLIEALFIFCCFFTAGLFIPVIILGGIYSTFIFNIDKYINSILVKKRGLQEINNVYYGKLKNGVSYAFFKHNKKTIKYVHFGRRHTRIKIEFDFVFKKPEGLDINEFRNNSIYQLLKNIKLITIHDGYLFGENNAGTFNIFEKGEQINIFYSAEIVDASPYAVLEAILIMHYNSLIIANEMYRLYTNI